MAGEGEESLASELVPCPHSHIGTMMLSVCVRMQLLQPAARAEIDGPSSFPSSPDE